MAETNNGKSARTQKIQKGSRMKLIAILFAVCAVFSGQASAQTECVTSSNLEGDYCYTPIAFSLKVATGGPFEQLSLVIMGNWMVLEPNDTVRTCEISFNEKTYGGVYKALVWSNVELNDQTRELFSRKGPKVTKGSAPFAGCIFGQAASLVILSSLKENTRYVYQRQGYELESFYRDEAFVDSDPERWLKELDLRLVQHAKTSKSRTAFDPTDEVEDIVEFSLFDRVLNIFQ